MTFSERFKKHKNNIAFITEKNEQISYQNFLKKIENFKKYNIPKKSLVFLFSSFSFEFITLYFYFIENRIIPFILNENLDLDKLKKLKQIYKPNFIFITKETKLSNFSNNVKYGDYFIYKNKNQKKKKIYKDLAILMSTSGSTGDIKFVKLSTKNILSNTKSICKYLRISKKDVAITSLPLSYSYGLSIINTHLYSGAKVVINTNSIVEKNFWKKFELEKVSSFSGVPYSFEILDKIKIFEKNLKNLKYFTVAGGAIDVNLLKKIYTYCKEKNKKIINMYGQTEATTRISYLPWKKLNKKFGSIGVPIPKGTIYIKNEKKKIIKKPYQSGELVYKGNNVMIGYASKLNDLSLKRTNNYELCTGDLGYFDNENYLFLNGRKKRIVKIYGHRISLDEIQNLLEKHKLKNASLCKKDKLIIFVQKTFDKKKLIKLICDYTKINMINLIDIRKIDRLPKTTNGKINYTLLENEYL